ncbi:hypothetical protein LCGC14_2762620 [marine sediment metagenome]|uniref:Nuclease-associated modular DNA-binding 1 domain-containing protein n=1 Tax=marine sediment metagenome TaxID=412755 RepID=A0A0F9B755_9ZZZZ
MKQEDTAGKILVGLMELGIVNKGNDWIVYNYLMQAYAVGYDSGSKSRSNQRPVAQYTLQGKLIEIYESATEASRRTKIDHSDISTCAVGKSHTAGGFLWEYIHPKSSISSVPQTIGSVKSKSDRPK